MSADSNHGRKCLYFHLSMLCNGQQQYHLPRTLEHDLRKPYPAQTVLHIQADTTRLSRYAGVTCCSDSLHAAEGSGAGVIVTCVLTVTELPDVTPRMMTWSLPTFAPWAMPEMYELCISAKGDKYAALALNVALNLKLLTQSLALPLQKSTAVGIHFNSNKGQFFAECSVPNLTDTVSALSWECSTQAHF